MRSVVVAIGILASIAEAQASGTIGYGSRAGMEVTVVSMSGLDTAHAVIRTRHTRENAISFCRDYVGKVTAGCIRDELNVRLNDVITANCLTGEFTDFVGGQYRLRGKNTTPDDSAAFKLIDLANGQVADGSSASSYPTNMGIFKALCPNKAPDENDWFKTQ